MIFVTLNKAKVWRSLHKWDGEDVQAAGGKDYIVSYGGGSFTLLVAGMYGRSSVYAQLIVLLLKRVCIVMIN